MKCATKAELRHEVVTLRNKLSAAEFELEQERGKRKAAEVAALKLYDKVKLHRYAVKHLEANQK